MRSATRNKVGKDKAYLSWVHEQPCSVYFCGSKWIEAHHAGVRGLMQKASDRTAVSLCSWHHRLGPESVHVLGKRFWAHHGLDRDKIIDELNARFARGAGRRESLLEAQEVTA